VGRHITPGLGPKGRSSIHLGSTVLELDDQGVRLRNAVYAPFGTIDQEVGSASGSYNRRFAGHPFQATTGFCYMKARWYDPAAGRFASVDPVISDVADPQSLNPYGYVSNNPINLVDPTGMVPRDGGIENIVIHAPAANHAWFPVSLGLGGGHQVYRGVVGTTYSNNPNQKQAIKFTFTKVEVPAEVVVLWDGATEGDFDAAFNEALGNARAHGLPSEVYVVFDPRFKVNYQAEGGMKSHFFTSLEEAAAFEKASGGTQISGEAVKFSNRATIFKSAFLRQQTVNVNPLKSVFHDFGSGVSAAEFVIFHEAGHARYGFGEVRSDAFALRRMGIEIR
jgi:RHS repeat-associated protein